LSNITNWFDIAQNVLILLTMRKNLDINVSCASHEVLSIATFLSWFELLLELHNFRYDLALFVVAIIKIMKRLRIFLFTTLMFIAAFAHAYYIAGPDDTELCNDMAAYLSKEEFNLAGGFTCTRSKSYEYSFFALFAFEVPSGVPQWIPYFYAFIMLILLLNIIIAVVVHEFEDVVNESELTFWSDRLVIVNELDFCSGTHCSSFTSFLSLIHGKDQGWCKNWLPKSDEKFGKRMDLNLFLENWIWDGMATKDELFLHWWYGRKDVAEKPILVERLKFFISNSTFKDIFIPSTVFENIFLGYNRSHRSKKYEKMSVFPFSIILMIASNALFAIIFISGWLSFGFLWPRIMKKELFSVDSVEIDKRGITCEVTKSSTQFDATKEDIGKIMVENNDLKKKIRKVTEKAENNNMKREIFEMRKEIQEILSKINSSTR